MLTGGCDVGRTLGGALIRVSPGTEGGFGAQSFHHECCCRACDLRPGIVWDSCEGDVRELPAIGKLAGVKTVELIRSVTGSAPCCALTNVRTTPTVRWARNHQGR